MNALTFKKIIEVIPDDTTIYFYLPIDRKSLEIIVDIDDMEFTLKVPADIEERE